MLKMIIPLLAGFLLSSILGGAWAFVLKRRSWSEETGHSLHQARFDEGIRFLDDFSELIGRRYFLLQRLWWAIEAKDTNRIEDYEKTYFAVVEEWNAKFWRNRNKIRLLVGDEQADYFLDYEDDKAGDKPNSLHYKFVITHRNVMAAKAGQCALDDARRHVTELNWKCSIFLERLTAIFMKRAASLQLLETPTGPGAAEQTAPTDVRTPS